MIQCISRIIKYIIHLWQTLKEYVCKKKIIRKADTDNDGKPEIILDLNGCPSEIPQDNELDKEEYDRESNSLLVSTGNEKIKSDERRFEERSKHRN